jgi:aspartyl-tRNA(Asn)/glutamyl-tRNA(Gln) amidotransferase subunit A
LQTNLADMTVGTLSGLLSRKRVSPVEILESVLARIDRCNDRLHSYITICRESALNAARRAEDEILSGNWKGKLHGIPIAHKDVTWTKGVRTTAHSRLLLDFVPNDDATHAAHLKQAGTILVGKTNTTEFACGGLELFGTPCNPWDLSKYTGGSSCGSGNAVAAGLVVAATGSDTGGSIRAPSALCGIVGLKPTYGRVSRVGLIPLSWSLDHVGPMARSVGDCAIMLEAMGGGGAAVTGGAQPTDLSADLSKGVAGLMIGVPERHFYEGLDASVERTVRSALNELGRLGAHVETVDLPRASEIADVGQILMYTEAFALHAGNLRRRGQDYSSRARRRIAAGAFYTAAEYQQAGQLRELWMRDLARVLEQVDVLVTPTVRFPAFALELQEAGRPPDTGLNTRPFNVSGHPALTVPCGFTANGLPVGMQIVGRAFDEHAVLRLGAVYEQATPWHDKRPSVDVVGP